MQKHHGTSALLLVIVFFSVSGCFYSREMSHIRRDIEHEIPGAAFKRQVSVAIGPRFFGTMGWITSKVDDSDAQIAADLMYEIRRVKVGVYKTEELPDLQETALSDLPHFTETGWVKAVKTLDRDEAVWIFYREDRDVIRNLYLVVLNDDELVLVRCEGHINRSLERDM